MSFLAFGLAALLSGGNLHALKVTNGSRPFAGDNRLLTTVSPNGDGFRDKAIVSFRLDRAAKVRLDVLRTDTLHPGRATKTDLERDETLPSRRAADRLAPGPWNRAAHLRPPADRRQARVHELAGQAPRGARRAHPGHRGRVSAPQLRAGRASRPADLDRRALAPAPGLLLLEPGDQAREGLQDVRHRDDEPGPRRLANAPRRTGSAAGRPRRELAERPLLPAAERTGRAGRLRAVRRHEARPDVPRRRRPVDEHVAGVQLLGRERRRLGRQLVRERGDADDRPRAPVPRLRRPVPLPRLGSGLHRVAEPDREARRLPDRRRPRGVSRPATNWPRRTTSSSSRAMPST